MKLPSIPPHWTWKTVGELGSGGKPAVKAGPFGSALKKEFYVESGFRIYGQEQVIAGDLSLGNYYIDARKFKNLKSCEVATGDILVSLVGTFGKILIVPNVFEPGIINPRLVRLSLNPEFVDPYFFSRYFQSSLAQFQMELRSHGGTMNILNAKNISDLLIPIPPIAEQKRIAAILDKAEELRSLRRKALAELDAIVQSIFLEMFGDPVTNPKGWNDSTLEEIAIKITDGEHLNPQFSLSGMSIVMAGNVLEDFVDLQNAKKVDFSLGQRFRKKCAPARGDILLVSRGATIGRLCTVDCPDEFCLMGSVILVKLNSSIVDSKYLKSLLKHPSMYGRLFKTSGSSAQQAIYLKDLKRLPCLLPPLSLQQEFTRRVEAIDRLKATQRQSLAQLDTLFASLQHRAFQGEL